MTDLTSLTLSQARDGLKARRFSATELADAHVAAIEKARALNAFVLETPGSAPAMATEADARLNAGDARPLEGLPLGIKDLFATKGVRTTACSHILDNFVPTYESTVTANLWRDGAVMLGKLNNDEFAMGSSNETSCFGPVVNPVAAQGAPTRRSCPAARRAVRRRRWRHNCAWARPAPTPAARSASPPPSPARSASSRPMGAARAGASWPSRPRSTRPDPSPARCATPPSCCARWPATIPEGHDLGRPAGARLRAAVGKSIKGMKIGIPKEYRVDGMAPEIERLWGEGIDWLKGAGAEIVEISLPHTKYALPAYYIVAPAEASSNLARYDGVRYGLRVPGRDVIDMYRKTRAEGFGKEVRRRVMIGTYVLSAGYYDAYYLRAQKVRTLIKRDFEDCFAAGVDAILTPATPSAAFGVGEKGQADPIEMYLNDVFTVTVNMAGLPGIAVPAGLSGRGCRSACSSSAGRSTRRRCSRSAR